MPAENAIIARHLSKAYRIWTEPSQRLLSPLLAETGRWLPGGLGRALRQRATGGYRDFFALTDVSFEVKRGEAVGIIGRNGAGKSTLLQIIAGTLQPSAGTIEVNGRVAALLELGAGFNPDFTGRENVMLSGAVLGLGRAEMEARFDEVAAFADIGEFIEQPVKTYSSGMMMRLAFAVNTCVDPEVLIVDEALSVGDAPFQSKCFRRLRQLIDQGVSLLFVSHDIGTVRSICSRALWLKNGRPELWGEAKPVAKEYEKFCWAEQGVVMTQAAAPAEPTEPSEIKPAAARQDVIGADASGEFTVPLPVQPAAPAALMDRGRPAGERYGTQVVTIESLLSTNAAGEPTARFEFNEAIYLHYLIRTHAVIDSDVVLGIRIKDPQGNFLYSVQDISTQHRLTAPAGSEFHAVTAFRLPLTHGRFIIKTGIFGFADGTSRLDHRYDYTRAVLWDIIEDGCVIDIAEHPTMPLCGPVHSHAKLVLSHLPFRQT
jgi:lipopolysaccharide transport system ATP-binding protein